MIFKIRDQRLLTAIFMEHNIFVEGYNVSAVKTDSWVIDPKSKMAKESEEDGVTNYDKFGTRHLKPFSSFLLILWAPKKRDCSLTLQVMKFGINYLRL